MTSDTKPQQDVQHDGGALEEDIFIADGEFEDGCEDEEIEFVDCGEGLDPETKQFDEIVGVLSDILVDPQFEEVKEAFCRENCKHFEDSDENKLIYTDLFSRYTALVEAAIEARLAARLAGFDMASFMAALSHRQDQLMSDVFDLLASLGDFEAFREVMLAYKRELGSGGPGLQIHCRAVRIHMEEQEDGEARPDLDCSLTISPVGPPPAHPARAQMV